MWHNVNRRASKLVGVLVLALISQIGLVPPAPTPAVAAGAQPATPAAPALDRAAALARLKPSDRSEEVGKRGINHRTFRTDAGYRVEVSASPLFYELQPGVFDDIDNTVVPATGGGKFRYQNKANGWRARFTDTPGENQVRVDWQGTWFAFELDEETGAGTRGFHATPAGRGLTYAAAGAPISVSYALEPYALKESIVLQRYTDKSAWHFRLTTSGLVVNRRDDGRIALARATAVSDPLWMIQPVVAFDAAGASISGGLNVEPAGDGAYRLVVSVSPDWLAAADRQYPVIIDPTVSADVGASMWTVLTEQVWAPYSGNQLMIKGDQTINALVKWDLRSLDAGLLASHQLRSATMQVYYDTASTVCSSADPQLCQAQLSVSPVAREWFRQSASWYRPLGVGTTWAVYGGETCYDSYQACPGLLYSETLKIKTITTKPAAGPPPPTESMVLTDAVARMLEGAQPNYGFRLSLADSGSVSSTVYFCVQNGCGGGSYAYSPTLVLDFAEDTVKPTVSFVNLSDGAHLRAGNGDPTQDPPVDPGTTIISVSASDTVYGGGAGDISRVELFVDNNRTETVSQRTGDNFVFGLNVWRYTAGHHRIFARAYDRAGNFQDTSVLNLTFEGGLMAAPGNLSVILQPNNQYGLTWGPAAHAHDDLTDPLTYIVQRSTSSTFTAPTTVATGVTAAVYTNTPPGAGPYYYRVYAVNPVDSGLSAPSNVATVEPPLAPFDVTGVSLANANVALAWQPSPSAYRDSSVTYAVYRAEGAGTAVLVASGVAGTAWTDPNPVANTTYSYYVQAVNLAGQPSGPTAAFTITSATAAGPNPPAAVRAVSDRNNVISVHWTRSSDPSITYAVYRSTDRTTWAQIASGLSGWFFNDGGGSEGTTYYYQVQAVQGGNPGPRSAIAGAMAISGRRLGVDSRWPYVPFQMAGASAYANIQNGNVVLMAGDSVVAAPYLPVVVRRAYNAQGAPSGSFGDAWRLNSDWQVEDFGSYAVLTAGDGVEHVYTFDGTSYKGDTLWYWTLSKDGSGNFVATRPDRIQYRFNAGGQLASIVERNGNAITYAYDQGRLAQITDPVGRTTSLSHDSHGRLTSITDGAGRETDYAFDSAGRLSSVTDAEGWTSTYQYDAYGRLVFAADPTLRWTALTYDDTGRVRSITDALGNRTTLAYSTAGGGGGTTVVTDAHGSSTFAYDSRGFLTTFTDAAQNTWQYTYTYMASDATKLQTLAIADPRGLQTWLSYDISGNVTQVADAGPDLTAEGVNYRTSLLSYLAGSSDLSQSVDAEQKTASYSYDASFRLQTLTDPLNHTVQYTYSTSPSQKGWVTAITDARGNQTQFAYDTLGNVTSTLNAVYVGSTLKTLVRTFTYYSDGSVADASELHDINTTGAPVAHTTYDKLGRRTRVEYPDGSQEAWVYDPSGHVAIQFSRGGQWVTNAYDAVGRLLSVRNQVGDTTTWSYDDTLNRESVKDPLGQVSTTEFDAQHRPVQVYTVGADPITQYTYDALGQVVSVARGTAQALSNGLGHTASATYYLSGLQRSVRELLRSDSVLPRDGTALSAGAAAYSDRIYQYNRVGKPVRATDGNGLSTSYAYDDAYRLVKVTDAAGAVTEYAYDENGNRSEVWDAINPRSGGGKSTQVTYDALNRQTSVKDPLGNVVSEIYADNGDVSSRTEQRLLPGASQAVYQTTSYSYDPGHRLTGISYPGVTGSGPVTAPVFVYDGGGRRLFRRDDYGLASYSYDPLGRLTRVISPQENMTLTYDQANNVVALGTSLGTASYSYDASGRMTGVTDPLGNSTAYHYDGLGRVSQIDLPGGYQRKVEYWALPSGAATNRLQSIKTDKDTTTYWGGSYQYDYAGHVRQISVSQAVYGQPATYTLTASYDAANRLTRWTDTSIAPQTTYYSYDAVGNRTAWGNRNAGIQDNHQTPAGTVVNQTATYNAASRVNQQWTTLPNNEKKLGPTAAPNVTYEPNGNLLTESYTAADGSGTATVTNTYNDAGQLVGMATTAPGTGAAGYTNTETYRYDADGRRVDWSSHLCTEVVGQSCIDTYKQYEYVGSDAVAERGQDGNVSVWYVLGQGRERLYTLHWDTAAVKLVPGVYAKDHLGSIRMLLGSGTSPIKNLYNYDAFGLPTSQTVVLSNSYQLGGGAMDQASMTTGGTSYHYPSLYNLKARLYNPASGRFLTQDTYRGNPWQPWTQNLYAYVGNNPVNYIDPTGHFGESWGPPGTGSQWVSSGVSVAHGGLGSLGFIARALNAAGEACLAMGPTLCALASRTLGAAASWLGSFTEAEVAVAIETGEMSSVALGSEGQLMLERLVGGEGGVAQRAFSTTLGRRVVDYLRDGVAYESKNGFVRWSSNIAKQIDKDAELLRLGQFDDVIWHFWRGADQSVLDYLAEHGIQWVIH